MQKLKNANKKIENTVVHSYQVVEDTVVGGYQKIEDAAVSAYKKVEDRFVQTFLAEEGETSEQAKARVMGYASPKADEDANDGGTAS